MSTVTIHPATPDRFADAQHALTGGGDGKSCQCQWWLLTNAEFTNSSADQRKDLLEAEITQGPPPALIAYVDDSPAGWVRVGPRMKQPRLARTKIIASSSSESFDDESVWAVSCFVVRREHRGSGTTKALLEAAVTYAKEHGARVIEGYPVDTSAGKASSNSLYVGTLSTFLDAGFDVVAHPKPTRAVVALTV